MLTTAAEAVVVELSRFAVRLTCSSHISSEQVGGRFSRRGVRAAEKISEVGFLYEDPGRPAQRHTNHKPRFHVAHRLVFGDLIDFRTGLSASSQLNLPAGQLMGVVYPASRLCHVTSKRLVSATILKQSSFLAILVSISRRIYR